MPAPLRARMMLGDERAAIEQLARSRTAPARAVERAPSSCCRGTASASRRSSGRWGFARRRCGCGSTASIGRGSRGWPTARAFCAAVDGVLATGDAGRLDALVAPDLVEQPPRPGAAGRAGFALSLPAEGALLVAIEAGGIEFGAEGGTAWTIDASGRMRDVPGRAEVAAGGGALTMTGPVGLWQAGADPAVLFLLAVVPAAG